MKYKIKIYFYLIFVCFINSVLSQNFLSKFYYNLLGNEDCKNEYVDLTHKALKDFKVKNPKEVSVKKMNSIGSKIACVPISSFTAFGIWFDEHYLDSCSQDEKVFQIYHEAAHYCLRHHQKALLTSMGLSLGAIATLIALHRNVNSYKLPVTAAAGTLNAVLIYLKILPSLVKQQETQADVEAAKKLISLGKKNIVLNYVNSLRKFERSDASNIWWPSNKEQIEYLTNLL